MHPQANSVVAETQLPAAVGAGVQVLQVAIHDVQLWGEGGAGGELVGNFPRPKIFISALPVRWLSALLDQRCTARHP